MMMEQLRRRKLNPHLGAEIDCTGMHWPLTLAGRKSLFETLMEHKVVMLRKTGLDTDGHKELLRALQLESLAGTEQVPKKDELLYETAKKDGNPTPISDGFFRVQLPMKGGTIVNDEFHSDSEYFHHSAWFTSLRMESYPRDPETGDIIPCGDTLFADMEAVWEDLPAEEKERLEALRVVYSWKCAFPGIVLQAQKGTPGAQEKLDQLNRLYPPVERPFARKHPITGKTCLMADRGFASHVVGKTKEETKKLLNLAKDLASVPEYQLRIGWRNEGDLVIFDNYQVKHRVVADFKDMPFRSRKLVNVATKGFPASYDVLLRPDAEVRINAKLVEASSADYDILRPRGGAGAGQEQQQPPAKL